MNILSHTGEADSGHSWLVISTEKSETRKPVFIKFFLRMLSFIPDGMNEIELVVIKIYRVIKFHFRATKEVEKQTSKVELN